MRFFAKLVNYWKLLTVFPKVFIMTTKWSNKSIKTKKSVRANVRNKEFIVNTIEHIPVYFSLKYFFCCCFLFIAYFFCFLCPFLTTVFSVCRTEFLLKTSNSFKTDLCKDMDYLKSWSKRKKARNLKKKMQQKVKPTSNWY